MRHRLGCLICACAVLVPFGRTLLTASETGLEARLIQTEEDPSKGSSDIDRTIAYPMARVVGAAKQALLTYGCDVKKEKPDYLECTRSRHVGAFVGSGGEKVTVRLTAKGDETRVVIETGKGFAGRLGKKNWSTPIFNEMLKTLKGS